MSIHLRSSHLQFVLNPEKGTWSLHGTHPDAPSIEDAWMRVNYQMGWTSILRTGKRKFSFIENWHKPQISDPAPKTSPQGDRRQITVQMGPDVNGISYQLEYALLEEHPLFIWRVTLENQGKHPIQVGKLEMLRAGFFPKRKLLPSPGPLSVLYQTKPIGYGAVRPHTNPGELGFFSNGWQSWSYSGTYGPNDVYRGTRLGFFAAPMWYAGGKAPKREPGYFISDMFGVLGDRENRTGILAGFLSQRQHFGTLEAYIADSMYPALSLWADGDHAHLNPGAKISTDWAVIQFVNLDDPDPLAPYLDAVAREHPLASKRQSPDVGWCSWYHFFQKIDADQMKANLQSAQEIKASIPLELFQIDDGFESQIGDWFEFAPGFPKGVKPLAKDIQNAGFTPGLWLAPYIVHSRSKLAHQQRKWLLRNRLGIPVNAGFVWNTFNKALDLTVPEALAYTCEVVRTAAHDWEYPYLKLDFLYAAALKGKYRDRTKTRAQVLRMGLEAIRESVGPNVTLLGCGCPIGPGIGIFDAMRIGADVAPQWVPQFIPPQAVFRPEPNMPATRNAIQNTLTRAGFHQRWWVNDPDCLLIRPDSRLSLEEVQSLATVIALTGGALLVSDDLPQVPPDRLRIAEQLIPLIGKAPQVLDWFDSPMPRFLRLDLENNTGRWHLMAVFNWNDQSQDVHLDLNKFGLDPGDYFAREFWTGEANPIFDKMPMLKQIPAHGVRLVSLRPISQDSPCYLGGDLHISQGLEVSQWFVPPHNGVHFTISRPGNVHGIVDVFLPRPPKAVVINQKEAAWQAMGKNRYRIAVDAQKSAEIEIQ